MAGVPLGARLRSWAWDYLFILGWLALVLVAVGIPQLLGWVDLSAIWSRPAFSDVFVGLITVAPYLAYLTLTEAGPSRATWGKRRSAIEVVGASGLSSGGRILIRNLVKTAPWQLGHMSAMRFALETTPSPFAITTFAASMAILASVVLPILMQRRGLHDVLAATRVRPTVGRQVTPAAGQER